MYSISFIGHSIFHRIKKKEPSHLKEISSVYGTIWMFDFVLTLFPNHRFGHINLLVRSAKQVLNINHTFDFLMWQ